MSTPTAPGIAPLLIDERQGLLSLDGIEMCIPAWVVPNLFVLWQEADQRGSDRLIPGSAGMIPYPRRATETDWTLGLVISGAVDWTGTPYSDPFEGLETNTLYLQSNVTAPIGTGDGCRDGELTMPSGAVRAARVHVGPLRLQDTSVTTMQGGPLWVAQFDLTIPAGQFL